MNKKGQLYILAAVILIGIAFAIAQVRAPSPIEATSAFDGIAENYQQEAPRMINSILQQGKNMSSEFDMFAETFYQYARSRDTQFEFVYILFTGEEVIIKSYFDQPIEVSYETRVVLGPKEEIAASRSGNPLGIQAYHVDYTINDNQEIAAKAILRSENRGNVRISVIK